MTFHSVGAVLEVALYMRAWIEIKLIVLESSSLTVALYMRAWIEMKYYLNYLLQQFVALYMRAWIEISATIMLKYIFARSPST